MSRIKLTAIVAFWAVVGMTLAGCGEAPQPDQRTQESSPEHDSEAEVADSDTGRSETCVTCRATLTSFEQDHPWSDDSSVGHDDGVAPLASFAIVEPSAYTDRAIRVLFKYTADDATASPPDQADIGSQFTFQIPEGALESDSPTIDNTIVRDLRKVEP